MQKSPAAFGPGIRQARELEFNGFAPQTSPGSQSASPWHDAMKHRFVVAVSHTHPDGQSGVASQEGPQVARSWQTQGEFTP